MAADVVGKKKIDLAYPIWDKEVASLECLVTMSSTR